MSNEPDANNDNIDVANGVLQSSTGIAGLAIALFALAQAQGISLSRVLYGIFVSVVVVNLFGSWRCIRILHREVNNEATLAFMAGIILLALGFMMLVFPGSSNVIALFLDWLKSGFTTP